MNHSDLTTAIVGRGETFSEPMSFQQFVGSSALDPALLELVKLLVSHLLPCPVGVARYRRRALRHGESAERARVLSRWQASRIYTERERAAFCWAEAVVKSSTPPPDNTFRVAREWFTEEELHGLTESILSTIAWSRSAGISPQVDA